MPLKSPNPLDKLKKAIKEENISSIEEIIKKSCCFYRQALDEAFNNENTELLTLLLRKNEYRLDAWTWLKNILNSPENINQMSQDMINVLTRDYISIICCDYLKFFYPSLIITIDDQKIRLLNRDNHEEMSIDSITNTLDSPRKERVNKAYDLLMLNHDKNYEALTNMLSDKETKNIFREYSNNLFIEMIQKLLDFLRKHCSKYTTIKINSLFFKDLTKHARHLCIENSINHPEQVQGMRPIP